MSSTAAARRDSCACWMRPPSALPISGATGSTSASATWGDSRVSLIFVDYPNRRRLKLLGHVRFVGPDDPVVLERLALPGYRARVERGFLIDVAAWDWNCPQHITPRFTQAEIAEAAAPLHARIAELERQLAGGTVAG